MVVGDYLHHVRIRNLSKLEERTERILRERNVEAEPVSPSLALPLFAAARDEAREEIQELFARLRGRYGPLSAISSAARVHRGRDHRRPHAHHHRARFAYPCAHDRAAAA